jgi:hypothetical protein
MGASQLTQWVISGIEHNHVVDAHDVIGDFFGSKFMEFF